MTQHKHYPLFLASLLAAAGDCRVWDETTVFEQSPVAAFGAPVTTIGIYKPKEDTPPAHIHAALKRVNTTAVPSTPGEEGSEHCTPPSIILGPGWR